MAFEYTVDQKTVWGSKRVNMGTYTNGGGDTGGTLVTGLRKIEFIRLQPTGAAVIDSNPSVNATFPLNSGSVLIVNTANEDGLWMAIGY